MGVPLAEINGTLEQASAMGLQAYLPVAFGVFVLLIGVGVGYILRDIAREHRLALKELAASIGADLRIEREAHLAKIVRLSEGMQQGIGTFIAGSAAQIGQLIAAGAQQQQGLLNALDQRALQYAREQGLLLTKTVEVLDSTAHELGRNTEALARIAPRTNGYPQG